MSKVQEFRDLENEIKRQQALLESMRESVKNTEELVDFIRAEAKEKNLDLQAIALEIAPQLAKTAKASAKVGAATRTPRKPRVVKVYINPHNDERVETKGGNHAILKSWKSQYGSDVVESWVQK